jgi:hypothetical protein
MRIVLPVLLAAMLLVPSGLQAHDTGAGETLKPNVPQLIDKDFAEGRIGYSEALRLKITWFKRSDLLPEKYKSALDVTVRCATPVLLEIDRNFDKLNKEDLQTLADIGLPDLPTILGGRPDYSYTLQSSVIPLRVHYETTDQLERAQKTLEVYEFSWARECDEIGFYEPPGDYGVDGSDDYDVYLSNTGAGVLGYTSPGTQVTDTWWDDRTSFIVHSRNLTSDSQISTTGCHEFNHACQMAMAYETSITFYENCATWVEPHVYFEFANDAWSYGWYCQREPEQAICWFDNSGLFQYGGFIWPEYIADRFNNWEPEIIRDIWIAAQDNPGSNQTNYFDAIVQIAEQYAPGGPRGDGWHLYDLLTEFAEWRYFCRGEDEGTHYTHGAAFHRVTVDATQNHATLPALCPAELPRMPEFFGMNYIRFDEAVTSQQTLKIFFEGERDWISTPLNWRLMIIKYYELGGAYDLEIHDVPTDTGNLLLEVTEADQCERLVMVVLNLGAGGTNPGYDMPEAEYYYMAWAEDDPNMSLLVAGPGPGAANGAQFRTFLSSDPSLLFADTLHSEDFGYGLNVATGDIDADGVEEIVCGYGADPAAPPEFYAYRLNGYGIYGTQQLAYGVEKYGVNVACGDIDGDGYDEIITGPGPGPPFGPQVRGWNFDNNTTAAIAGVNFFAYGTLKWGVNVACGDIDGDGYDEIVTGAGPGAVFGPHVRAWNYDNSGTVTSIGAVSYLAYGTPKWGVNVACGDIDSDGIDEIVTGAGPGAIYGPHVRGWNYDGGTLGAMTDVSFLAYGTNKFGVNVTCGDVDNDGVDEIVTGAGPGQVFGAHVRGWNYDGGTLTPISTISFFAYDSDTVRYGANVAVADMHVD